MLPALGQCSTTGTENKLEYPPTKPHRPACPSATKPRPLSEGGLHGTSRRLDSCSRVLHSFVNNVPVTALRCQFPTPPMQGELSVNGLKEAGLTATEGIRSRHGQCGGQTQTGGQGKQHA